LQFFVSLYEAKLLIISRIKIMKKLNLAQCIPMSAMCAGSLLACISLGTEATAAVPTDPDTFLTFLEKHVPEDAISAAAYYAVVDPDGKKATYADWLFETGFIDDPLDYATTGAFADHVDAAVTHKNETDLGFVRRVRVRCEPNCDNPNPDIYSVIENYLTFDDAANRTNRLASVTMEWTSAADGSNPSDKFVVFYAYTGADSRNQIDSTTGDTIPFQPDLDTRGEKPYQVFVTPVMAGHRESSRKMEPMQKMEIPRAFFWLWI
jgi:hypothetical protein